MDYVPICSKEAVQVGCKSVEDIHYFCMMADTQMGLDGQNPSKIYPRIFWGVLKKVDFERRSTRKINHGGGRGPFAVVGLVCYLDSALAVAFHCSSIERTKGALCMLDVPCLG